MFDRMYRRNALLNINNFPVSQHGQRALDGVPLENISLCQPHP